jgi:hypothetical protein
MDLLLAGLAGVVVGALVAAGIILYVIQRRADRDLLERRIRACAEYLDCLGDVERALRGAEEDRRLLEQAWANARAFRREFLLTGWLLSPAARRILTESAAALERAEGTSGTNGAGGSRTVQLLCEKYHEIRRILAGEMAAAERSHRSLRYFPELSRRGE